jgi:hypothetical protein
MIPNKPENKRPIITAILKPRTLKALNDYVKKTTGNRSFIVNLAVEEYLGLEIEEIPQEETEKIAS